MDTWNGLALAITSLWLGMVLAISFVEAPLKFRAPGVTVPVGLAIGRVVFGALNRFEMAYAAALVVGSVWAARLPGGGAAIPLGIAIAVLVVQLVGIRPALTKRSDAVLAGATLEDAPRSHAHLWYVGTEVVKALALLAAGIALLTR
ncbi:hypothetical protein [Nocardioides montaniterrae]